MDNLFSRKDLIYTIYREKSFSKAAQKLFIAQPSLSLMVKKIEEQIGAPLFDRTCKPIRLTETGREYIAAVEQIERIETSFQNYIRAADALEVGSLSIGSSHMLSALVLPRYITAFQQQYPNIKISLLEANSTTLENALTEGQLDIIISNHLLPEDIFAAKHLATEHLLLAVPADFPENNHAAPYHLTYQDILLQRHLDRKLPTVPLELFQNCPFILMNRNNNTRKLTNSLFQEIDFAPHVLLELDLLVTLYSYIEQGIGASVVSDTMVRNIRGVDNSRIVFYPLPTKHARREIYASYKRNKYFSKAMAKFIENLGNLQ